ncbi:anaerobic magnesium-protoporphyrin IX monomethyl ester cyclase [Gammaproteobacteria bacterium]
MQILIVAPRYTFRKGDYYEFPLGLGYITAVLKRAGHRVEILNLNRHEDEDAATVLRARLAECRPTTVMTGGLTAFYPLVKQILDTVRAFDPAMVTIVGGGIVSSELELMTHLLKPDFVVDGEGEVTVVDLMDNLERGRDPSTVAGIGFLRDGAFIRTPPREVMSVADMESLPMPDFDAFGLDEYFARQTPAADYYLYHRDDPRVLPIITSRSCPLKCTFCFHPLGNKYRLRDLRRVEAEIIEMKRRYSINTLLILDELMTGSKRRLLQFCEMMKGLDLQWICQLWTNLIDAQTIRALADSGCYYISFGLESASDTILKSMEKHGCTLANMEEGLALTRAHRIGIQGNFIFGDKNETTETVRETLDWWQRHPEYQINLAPIIPYPGSPDFRNAVARGIISDRAAYIKSGCPPINMSKMSDTEYEAMYSGIFQRLADSHNRLWGEALEVTMTHHDPVKDVDLFTLTVRCPHCHATSSYRNFHQKYLGHFKLACRDCAQRFDLPPTVFPNSREWVEKLKTLFRGILDEERSLWMTPCLPENRFVELMELVEVRWHDLKIEGVLDRDPSKIGRRYLGTLPIRDRATTLRGLNGGEYVVAVLPSVHAARIRDELTGPLALAPARILMLDPRAATAGDVQVNRTGQRNDVAWFYQDR